MSLSKLHIHHFRNLQSVSIDALSPGLNILYGQNASGKTSFLEAIYTLGMGKSFRSKQFQEIIQHEQPKMAIFAEITEAGQCDVVGMEKTAAGESLIKLNGQKIPSITQVARRLPIQLLTPHSFHLLETGPEYKRKYIDWGVFHVEHIFMKQWRNFKRALKQRNAAFKARMLRRDEIALWDKELSTAGTHITEMRHAYLTQLIPVIKAFVAELLPIRDVAIRLHAGWDTDKPYAQVLDENFDKDARSGHTQYGPHRADLIILINGKPAHEVLSRGQQKLFVCAMTIAQGILLKQTLTQGCLFLIDDLVSELDQANRQKALSILSSMEMQIFASCVELDSLNVKGIPAKMFHVEHGRINETIIEKKGIISA